MKIEYISLPNDLIEVKDPPREACIINVDRNGNEISREYFGNNARVEINENYNG